MFRLLFTFLSALSLLLCVTAFVLLVRSYDAATRPVYEFTWRAERWEGGWTRGAIWFDNEPQLRLDAMRRQAALLAGADPKHRPVPDDQDERWALYNLLHDRGPPRFFRDAVARERFAREQLASDRLLAKLSQKPGGVARVAVLSEPVRRHRAYSHSTAHNFLILGTLVLPAVWFAGTAGAYKARRQRRRKGLCVRCGYDLRATPGRCPECGIGAGVTA